VKGWSPVEHYRVAFQDIFENIPDDGFLFIYQLTGAFYRFYDTALNQFANNKRLKEFCRHIFWQTALVHFEFGPYNDYRTTGVVHPLTEQVLTETTLLTFQHIAERFEGAATFCFYSFSLRRITWAP
jgi:hypothetical protein